MFQLFLTKIFTDVFGKYALNSGRISLNQFQEFLQQEQNEVKYTDYIPYFRQYVNSGSKGLAYMTAHEVTIYTRVMLQIDYRRDVA